MASSIHRGLALALLLGVPSLTTADEIADQITAARDVYESGELRKSVQDLQYAIAEIQEQINAANASLAPEPLAGWTATEAVSGSGGLAAMVTGTSISRGYSRDDGAKVTIEIMADSPLMGTLLMTLSNPMLMQMSPGTRMYRHQGHNGMIKHEAGTDAWDINLLMQGRILVQVSGHGLNDKAPVEAYLQAIDLNAVLEAFAN